MKVLVYVDGSDASLRAVDQAIELAKNGAEVTALHVFPPRLDRDVVSHFEIEPADLDLEFGKEVLERAARKLSDAGIEAESRLLEGPLSEVIRTQAEEGGFDLILMGARREVGGANFDLPDVLRRKCSLPVEVIA